MVKPITHPNQVEVGRYYFCDSQYVVKITGVTPTRHFKARCWGSDIYLGWRRGIPYVMNILPEEWIDLDEYTIIPIANEEHAKMYAHLIGDPIKD